MQQAATHRRAPQRPPIARGVLILVILVLPGCSGCSRHVELYSSDQFVFIDRTGREVPAPMPDWWPGFLAFVAKAESEAVGQQVYGKTQPTELKTERVRRNVLVEMYREHTISPETVAFTARYRAQDVLKGPIDPLIGASVCWFFDRTGETRFWTRHFKCRPLSDDLATVQIGVSRPGAWGYVDSRGEIVIRPGYESAGDFSDGLAPVAVDAETLEPRYEPREGGYRAELAYGYIDVQGQWAISPQFTHAGPFREGLAPVIGRGGGTGFIATTGRLVLSRPGWSRTGEFREGLAPVRMTTGREMKWGFVDKTGSTVIPARFDDADVFSEGLCAVKIGERWGYIDRAGKMMIHPQFREASRFQDGFAVVVPEHEQPATVELP